MSYLKNISVIVFGENHLQLVQSTSSARGQSISNYSITSVENISDNNTSQALVKLTGGKAKLKQTTVIAVLPRAPILLRYLMLPSQQEAELRNMVDLQIAKHIPFSREDVIIDMSIVQKESSGYSRVIVAVYPKEVIHQHLKICAAASVAPQILTIGPLGALGWYLELLKRRIFSDYGTTMIIDVEARQTEVVFCSHHKFAFARTIKMGTQEIVNGKTHDLVHQINQTIAVFLREKLADKVDQFVLIAAIKDNLTPLLEELQKEHETPVHLTGPWDGIPVQKSLNQTAFSKPEEPSWATPVGIALTPPGSLMNFIPQEVEAIKSQKQRQGKVVRLAVLAVMLIMAIAVALNVPTLKKNRYMSELEVQLKSTKKQVDQIENKAKQIEAIGNLIAARRPFSDVLYELQPLIPEGVVLTSLSMDDRKKIELQGYTKNNPDVNRLQKSILDSALFDQATLDYVNKRKTQDGEVNYFKITSQIVPREKTQP